MSIKLKYVHLIWNIKCFWKYTICRKSRPRNACVIYRNEITGGKEV